MSRYSHMVGMLATAAVLVAPGAAGAAGPGAAQLDDWILDPAARGNVTYENTANVASYQQDGGWSARAS
jgi:hypothetical protein